MAVYNPSRDRYQCTFTSRKTAGVFLGALKMSLAVSVLSECDCHNGEISYSLGEIEPQKSQDGDGLYISYVVHSTQAEKFY